MFPVSSDSVELFRQFVAQTSDYSLEFEVGGASGSEIWDTSGTRYFDFTSGIGVMNIGHSHPRVQAAIERQLPHYSHTMVYGEHIHKPVVEYAEKISRHFNKLGDDKQVFFVNSGNEAIDLALKMAKKITGRDKLVAVEKGFHGRGTGALQVTWNDDYAEGFGVDRSNTVWVEDYDTSGFVLNHDVAAVVVELVQGEAGANPLNLEMVKKFIDRAREVGALVIIDEVQTGYMRTGKMFAQDLYGVSADITCLGKAGGGGLPFGAVVAEKRLFEKLQQPALSHISTFGGNPIVCAAGMAVWDVVSDPKFQIEVQRKIELLELILEEAVQSGPVFESYTGVGMLRGIQVTPQYDTFEIYKKLKTRGVLTHFKLNAGQTLRISPPLTITVQELIQARQGFNEVGSGEK